MTDQITQELIANDQAWKKALAENDIVGITTFMHDDWILVGTEGRITDRARFLEVVTSGEVTHDAMDTDDWRVKVYGDTAVVTCRTVSKGYWKGNRFESLERDSSVYIKQSGRWLCVLTQLAAIKDN